MIVDVTVCLSLRYASVGMIFAVNYGNNVPVNSNSELYKSWFFSDYISDMTVANSKASAPLATVHILSRFAIYEYYR